ncbi:hypothetical protein O3M35_003381 [Rhynocoris fuscipes]|uniref:Transmembrane protein n=1 Tax=Rhynocoris fuscipes TaxID=488301 RepID=A0AAW1CMS0_9HEMI
MYRLYQNFNSIGQCCQQNSSKFQIFYQPYLKNGFSQLKNCLYSFLLFYYRGATSLDAKNTFCVVIRSFLNALSCNFIFSSFLQTLFLHKIFNLIR